MWTISLRKPASWRAAAVSLSQLSPAPVSTRARISALRRRHRCGTGG